MCSRGGSGLGLPLLRGTVDLVRRCSVTVDVFVERYLAYRLYQSVARHSVGVREGFVYC